MPSLNLNGKTFSFEELKSIFPEESQSEFEKTTLKFCKAWLTGQKEFTINTSGSTGTPKEIRLKRGAMEVSAQMTINALHLKTGDTALVCLDTKYIAGQMMLVRSLVLGMNLIAVEPSANPFDNIDQPIDFTALVPYQLENILNQSPENLDSVRCAIIGGAAVSNSLKEKIKKTKCTVYATYGMTETISHVALQKLNGPDLQEYFEALENVRFRVDERGCLCIKANHLDREIITNDLVTLISSQKFKWLGRIDNVINSGGIKIIPEKIESVLEKIFDSLQIKKRFFVAGLPDEKLGQRVVAV
ncbi:MAG: AMP-binding protein, partial [Bacteroidetes bacterium]|nr:AMP-binding protein [Bacteroidota bacterium]